MRRPSTSRCPRTPRSCSRAASSRTTSGSRARSATTPATTRRPSRSRSSASRAMTMRRDAIYPSIVVGKPPAGGRVARQGDRADLPARDPDDACRRSSTTTCRSRARSTTACIVSIRKAFPGHAQKVMHAIWGLGMLSALEVDRRRRRARGRPRLRGGLLPRRRERRPDARRPASPRARSTTSTTRRRASSTAASSASTRPHKRPEEDARPWPRGDRDEPTRSASSSTRRWAEYGRCAADARPARTCRMAACAT